MALAVSLTLIALLITSGLLVGSAHLSLAAMEHPFAEGDSPIILTAAHGDHLAEASDIELLT